MKVNIGYLNCYDSILGSNLIKIFFITPNIKCVFQKKLSFMITQNSAFCCARMLIANTPPATEFNFKTDLLVTVFLVMT